MKIVTSLLPEEIIIESEKVVSLVIENQRLMLNVLEEIYNAVNCGESNIVFSVETNIIKASQLVELITTFVPFEMNEKRFISKISALLEHEALNEHCYADTIELLTSIEYQIDRWADCLPCSIEHKNINVASLIKMCGIAIDDDSASDLERVFNYMMIVRELLGERLFIFVNMRSFFDDTEMKSFIDTVIMHGFYVLLIEGQDRGMLDNMKRVIIDSDLCMI